MYGKSDIYNSQVDALFADDLDTYGAHGYDEFGKFRIPSPKQVFSNPGRGLAAILTGGVSELVRGKKGRLKDLEGRIDTIVGKLDALHDQGKMDKAQKRAKKLAGILDSLTALAAKAGRPAQISSKAKAWAAYGEDGNLERLEQRLGKVLWSEGGSETDEANDWRDDEDLSSAPAQGGGIFPGTPGGMYIAAPSQGLVPSHDTGVRGGISIPAGGYAPAYTAVAPSQAFNQGFDQGYSQGNFAPQYAQYEQLPGADAFLNQNRRLRNRNRRLKNRLQDRMSDYRVGAKESSMIQNLQNRARNSRNSSGFKSSNSPIRKRPSSSSRGTTRIPPRRSVRSVAKKLSPKNLFKRKSRRTRMGAIDAAIAEEFGSLPGTIGIDAWGMTGSGITRADLLESTAIDDILDADISLAYDDGDDEEVFGFVRRKIEKDLESTRRKIERMNSVGLRNKRDHKRFSRLTNRFKRLQQAMTDTRERAIPLYTDPMHRSLFQNSSDVIAEAAAGGSGLARELVQVPILPTSGETFSDNRQDSRDSRKDMQTPKHLRKSRGAKADPRLTPSEQRRAQAKAFLAEIAFETIPEDYDGEDVDNEIDLLDDEEDDGISDSFGGGWW